MPAQTEQSTGRHILLAEDQAINAQIMKNLLGARNVTTDIVENGQGALVQFEASPYEYYDMILMDIYMPVMTGVQATQTIRKMNRLDARTIPVIALTADAGEASTQKYLSAGFDDVLPKPVQPALLDALLLKWTPVPLDATDEAPRPPKKGLVLPMFRKLEVAVGMEYADNKFPLMWTRCANTAVRSARMPRRLSETGKRRITGITLWRCTRCAPPPRWWAPRAWRSLQSSLKPRAKWRT